MKSKTCKSAGGQHLEEYHSHSAAEHGAEELRKSYSSSLSPYQCRTCGYWHLRAENTRKQCHLCMDGSLFHKDIYASREEAQNTAQWLKREKKLQVYPYRCPHGTGWHLTKKNR